MEGKLDMMGSGRQLTGQIIKIEQNLTAGNMTETDLADPSSEQDDCRVH